MGVRLGATEQSFSSLAFSFLVSGTKSINFRLLTLQRLTHLSLSASLLAAILFCFATLAVAHISDRKREPVVIRLDASQFPNWVDQGISAQVFELWNYRDGVMVAAFDHAGNESLPSMEVEVSVP